MPRYTEEFVVENLRYLSPYERGEIREYMSFGIYYTGSTADKPHMYVSSPIFADNEGYYIITARDHIKYRYEVISILGRGAYGLVVKCYDHKTDTLVAIKIAAVFMNDSLAEEYYFLEKLNKKFPNKKDCLVQIIDKFVFRNHYCIVEELLSHDLENELTCFRRGFKEFRIRDILRSTFEALKCIHSIGVVHGDVKTSNIVVQSLNSKCAKLIDFGLSHYMNPVNLATYMGTRYYRAPEIILRMRYGYGIDVWAMGCVAAEMILGYPLFRGRDEADQLDAIMEVIGLPPRELVSCSPVGNRYFAPNGIPRSQANRVFRRYPGSKPLEKVLQGCKNRDLVDLIKKCLSWDPNQRLSASQALEHKFFSNKFYFKLGVFGFIITIVLLCIFYLVLFISFNFF